LREEVYCLHCVITRQSFSETNSLHPDNFNISPKPNTDGIIKCLLQPGRIRNQLFTSMLTTSFHLLNLVYPDSSCCRDKVNRAAGRRAVGSVFCSPFIQCIVTSKWRFHYRDSYVISFYRDQTTCVHLPGLAKNSPTPTQTSPNYTTEPLAHIFESEGLSPRTTLIKFYLDDINSTLLPGLALARQTFALAPSL
jgi:hypothetical protein